MPLLWRDARSLLKVRFRTKRRGQVPFELVCYSPYHTSGASFQWHKGRIYAADGPICPPRDLSRAVPPEQGPRSACQAGTDDTDLRRVPRSTRCVALMCAWLHIKNSTSPAIRIFRSEAEAYATGFLEGCSAGRIAAAVNSKEGKEAGIRQGCHQEAVYKVAHRLHLNTEVYAGIQIPKAKWPEVQKIENKCLARNHLGPSKH